jgi:hypothetical protein
MIIALVGALILAALSTLYDFIWAYFHVRHQVVNGLVHGTTLLSVAGAVLGWSAGRPVAGLLGGALAGLVSAASFYLFYPVLGYLSAILAAWGLLWLLFAGLTAWLRGVNPFETPVLLRGLAAAVASGLAFYLVSGMWTDHTAPPNYLRNFVSWTFAFFPGFAALLGPTPRSR